MALPPPSFSNPYDELGRVDPERYRHYIESTISSVPASRSPSPTHSQSRSSSSHSHSHSHFHPHPHPHHRSPSGSPSQAHSRSTSGGARSHLSSITSHADSTDQAHAQALANADANADAGANADLPDYDHAQRTKSGINFAGRDSFSYESSYGIPLPDPIRASVYGALQGTRFGSRAASASAGANTTDRQQRYRPQRPRTADEIAVNAVLNPQELVSAPGSGDMDLDRRRRHVSAQGPGPFLAGGAGGGYASSPRASHPNHLGPRGGGRLVPGFWPPPSDFAAAGGPGPSTEDLVNFQDPSFARPLSFPGFDHRTPSEPGSRADSVDMRNEDAVLHDQQAALRTLISREEEGAGGGAGGAGAGGLPPKTSEEKAPVQLHIYRDTILPGYSFRKRALVARSPSGSRRASGARGQEGKGPGGLEGLEHGENGEEEEEEEVLVARVPRQLSGWKAVLMRAEGLRADTKKKKLVGRTVYEVRRESLSSRYDFRTGSGIHTSMNGHGVLGKKMWNFESKDGQPLAWKLSKDELVLTSQPSGHPLAYYRRTRKDANGAPKKNAGIGKNEQAQLPLGMVETLPPPKKIGKTLLSANAGAGNGQDSAEGGKGNAGTGGKASNANATVNATATAKPKGMSKRASKALQSKSSARETEDDEREKEKDEREKEKDESPRPVEIELVVASLLAIFSMKSPDSVGALVPDLPGAGHGAGHGTQTQTQAHTKRDLPPFLAPPRRTETILSETTVAFAPRDPEEEESAGAGGVRANQAQALNEAAQRSPAQVLRET